MPLLFVPTPLGNLRDITLRALEALRDCDLLVAEDSRVARKLLSALDLPGKEIWTYHEHNARGATENILQRAQAQRVAVVTDAGMPGISDPGTELVGAAREAGVPIDVLPGPSAAFGVAVLSGFPLDRWAFEGFPERSRGARRRQLEAALSRAVTTLWYESPRRIRSTLEDLAAVAPDARIFLVREYTKLHEQQVAGTPAAVSAALADPVRGEIAFAIAPAKIEIAPQNVTDDEIDALLAAGRRVGDVAKELAKQGRGERNELYARAGARKRVLEDRTNR